MTDDVTGQARDVDVIADGIARFRGMDEPDATDRDEARAIVAALADAELVIAPINPTAEMLHSGCGSAPDRQLLSRAIWGAMVGAITSPAAPSPAADRPEPEQAG